MLTSDELARRRKRAVRGGYKSRTSRSGLRQLLAAPAKLVPDFEKLGHQPFTTEHVHALARRLLDPNWPKGALNIFGLEGFLTALLVLPLCIRPTVWLPLIWNESGWKIPVTLQGADDFQQFTELLGGLMRAIDTDLCATPPLSASILEKLAVQYRPPTPHPRRDWAQGFGLAISQSSYLTTPVDDLSQRALYAIAIHAKPLSVSAHHANTVSPRAFRDAIITLARMRHSRGPLGSI